MAEKHYITAQSLLEDSFRLGAQILNSGFRPTFMIAVWRGGAPIGIAVQEFLDYHGVHTDHIAVRTSSYHGIDQQSRSVRVHGLNYLVKHVTHDDDLLIVDDVFDTGRSVVAIIEELRQRARLNTPHDIRVAVPYYKPARNEVGWAPEYYLHETDAWLKYPHSLEGLTPEEIASNRPELHAILAPHLK
ncbi:phosphoribosyltransferase [Aquisalimonas sp.]|uniref:phosphoribosyltransferase n=1 Tax=unclassified Aquisalimonas TaxID=2644645 RepID=UPI0025C44B19|nr:phosphoribosyltransferase family protein [Aquisalimonas sp.]